MKNESKSWWHVFLSWQIMALCMFFSNIPVSYAQSPDKITVAGCVKDAAGDFLIGCYCASQRNIRRNDYRYRW